MDRIKAMKLMSEIRLYLTAGNPVWDLEVVAEACDMAIEALRNEINCVKCEHYTERETPTGINGVCKMDTAHRGDTISRQAALKPFCIAPDGTRIPEVDCDNFPVEFSVEFIKKHLLSLPSAEAEDRLYIKIYADDEPSVMAEKLYQICGETQNGEVAEWIKEYFPSAEPKTGAWVEVEDYNGDIHYQCDQCGEEFILIDGTPEDNNYWHCPNCGSYNREVRKNEQMG